MPLSKRSDAAREAEAAARASSQAVVTARLREAIAQGRFAPGEALKIRDIAQAFGTSTQPVRAAIKQLVTEQALQALPQRSARVPLLSHEKLDDLTRVRIAVEGLAVSLAAERATRADLRELKALLKRRPQSEDEALAGHRAFHLAVYRLSGSSTLMPIIESLWLQLGPYLRQATRLVRGQGIEDKHHLALIAALEASDRRAAMRAVEADIRGSAALFEGGSLAASAPAWQSEEEGREGSARLTRKL